MARKKVTVIGAGNVGATVAQQCAQKELADVALVDIIDGLPQGKALDLLEAGPVERYSGHLRGSNSYDITSDSDIIVITAGLARKPGMSRDDLLLKNAGIVKDVVENVASRSPNAIIIMVTNPLDAMAHLALKVSGFPKNRVIGMAGVLDSARFRTFISEALNVDVANTHAFVLGGHGDEMVPLPRYSTVAGIPITELFTPEKLAALIERTRKGGGEIVALLKTGSAYYAPGSSAVEMVDAILKDKKKILPCAAYLEGEYDANGIFLGVPVKLGAQGIEEIIQIKLLQEEKEMLQKSIRGVTELIEVLKKNNYL